MAFQAQNSKTNTTSQVNVLDLQRRFRSKKEMYDFLVHDCKAFLPKINAVTIFFMKQITKADKDVSAQLKILGFSSPIKAVSLYRTALSYMPVVYIKRWGQGLTRPHD
jgi:hypothetical protein